MNIMQSEHVTAPTTNLRQHGEAEGVLCMLGSHTHYVLVEDCQSGSFMPAWYLDQQYLMTILQCESEAACGQSLKPVCQVMSDLGIKGSYLLTDSVHVEPCSHHQLLLPCCHSTVAECDAVKVRVSSATAGV